uniref:SH3b domain-containing protein n=1 Tax=uncultured bacterium esnapd14 TaxID=1366594 RepID=S5TL87_9BACT|nr:hypothetical protein [uncultured bacterium esnapd14]
MNPKNAIRIPYTFTHQSSVRDHEEKTMSHKRIVAGLVAALAVLTANLIAQAPAGAIGPAAPSAEAAGDIGVQGCARADHPWSDKDRNTGNVDGQGVHIRTGPHTSCTSLGLLYPSYGLSYDCFDEGDTVIRNGITFRTWTHLRRNGTTIQGWVSDAYLNDAGSFQHC